MDREREREREKERERAGRGLLVDPLILLVSRLQLQGYIM